MSLYERIKSSQAKISLLGLGYAGMPLAVTFAARGVKAVENSRRGIDIAFTNELAMAFDRMGIDTREGIDGMNTEWNALNFYPGLVGGHCIGAGPYYERTGRHVCPAAQRGESPDRRQERPEQGSN